jgi:hypothetical protein
MKMNVLGNLLLLLLLLLLHARPREISQSLGTLLPATVPPPWGPGLVRGEEEEATPHLLADLAIHRLVRLE